MSLDELGSLLREAREAKGFSLADVQNETRIQAKFIEALEDGRYHNLPTAGHAKGFLRNYAKFLGLDPKPLIERLELNRERVPALVSPPDQDRHVVQGEQLPLREDQPFFDPVNVEIENRSRDGGSATRLIIIVALIIALALVANRFIPLLTGTGDENGSLTEGLEEAISEITGEGEPTSTPSAVEGQIPAAGQVITSTNRNDAIQLPTPTPTRPVLPATFDTINLRLDITERTWMRVTIDDDVVFEGLARKGDEPYVWQADNEATLLTGNAIGIFVTINEIELGRLGGRAEVVEETWTTTDS